MHRVVVALFALWISVATLALADEQLVAVGSVGGTEYFVIRDNTTGRISDWLRLGDTYRDRKLSGYDQKTETLRLVGPKGDQQLQLVTAHVHQTENATAPATPFRLSSGTVTVKDGKILYSPDAVLTHTFRGTKHMFHAASGTQMESDVSSPAVLRGNLVVLSSTGVSLGNATYDANTGQLKAQTITLLPRTKH